MPHGDWKRLLTKTGIRLVPAALLCGCYAEPHLYQGVGALHTGGGTTELASHAIVFTHCPYGATGPLDEVGGDRSEWRAPFTVVTVGDGCEVTAREMLGGSLRVQEGTTCILRFPDHTRSLRLTDIMIRYGDSPAQNSLAFIPAAEVGLIGDSVGTYKDLNHVEVQLSGYDATDGRLAMYRFVGRAAPGSGDPTLCERPWHESQSPVPADPSPRPSGEGGATRSEDGPANESTRAPSSL